MKDGFIKAAAASPDLRVADCAYNADQIIRTVEKACDRHVQLLALPELCITGYTCGDLFAQRALQEASLQALEKIALATALKDILIVVGVPLLLDCKLYNCAALLYRGDILGVVPKSCLPNYGEFYEARQFTPAPPENTFCTIGGHSVPFGPKLLFRCKELPEFCLALEVCEDLWVPEPPSASHAIAGATVICNASASDEVVGKADFRRQLAASHSARLLCGYLYADAGSGESTTDLVFSGHNLLYENGALLAEALPFSGQMAIGDLDLQRLAADRQRMGTFPQGQDAGYNTVEFSMALAPTPITRKIPRFPFVPDGDSARASRCEEILTIQAMGLKKRLEHIGSAPIVIGISGGLDSTLALLVSVQAMDLLHRPRTDIFAATMPCFGTTKRTRGNAQSLCRELGVTLKTIRISRAVEQHFKDIGQDPSHHDVTYENAQARERTQVLMDLANQVGGIVVGTGDLSELALGWATYNGDHMSMYGVNASIPKTLVRHLVHHAACEAPAPLRRVLTDILDTPVSPELLPASPDGTISQVTEDLVGPYELHDFFLYYILRFGFAPAKVFRLACIAFDGVFDPPFILRWLRTFYRRFFSQQFKRSCLPDGPKVGTVTLSPRGDWRMPSDACAALWLKELEGLS